MGVLTPKMEKAIDFVRANARESATRWAAQIRGVPGAEELLEVLGRKARIAVHFHPERRSHDGRSVAECLLDSGVFKTQWETGTSTGSPSAFIGGARDVWEARLFGGAYEGTDPRERPRYGALRLFGYPDGPAPRFGSSYLVLAPHVLERTTFTYPGSQEPQAVHQAAPPHNLAPVLGPLLAAVTRDRCGLGVDRLTAEQLVERARRTAEAEWVVTEAAALGAALDSFVEAQVHGPIRLHEDVVGVVSDPAFRGTRVEKALLELCARWQLELSWHAGFVCDVSDVPETFRGWSTGALARRIGSGGLIDARVIGEAANHFEEASEDWPEFESRSDALTAFRRVWHALVYSHRQGVLVG